MKSIKLFLLALTTIMVSCQNGSKTYQWRGSDRTGNYSDTGLQKSWKAEGPSLIWQHKGVGNGYGSPVVTEDRVYIMGEEKAVGYLYAFDLQGKQLWKKSYGKEWVKNYIGSRCTPTVKDNLIYVSSGLGEISCFDIDGNKKWRVDLVKKFHGKLPFFGYSESMLIDGDKMFAVAGGPEESIVALNRHNGELIWSCKAKGEGSAYNSPILINRGGKKILVTFSSYHLLGVDTENGKLLWSHLQDNTPVDKRGPGRGDTHSNSPIYENGFIYYVAGDGNCGVKLELSEDGNKIKEIWRNSRIDGYMGGLIKLDNKIYASGTRKKDLRSINSNTGELLDSLKIGSGTIISAENMLYYYSDRGRLNLIKTDGDKMEKISSFKLPKGTFEHFSHPTIKDGILYIRHGDLLLTYDIKA